MTFSVAGRFTGISAKRRARLARTLLALSVVLMFAAGMVTTQSATATDPSQKVEVAFNYVSVMPGDTLWDLANTYAEGMNEQDWIAEVILLNNLASPDLVAGEKLALP